MIGLGTLVVVSSNTLTALEFVFNFLFSPRLSDEKDFLDLSCHEYGGQRAGSDPLLSRPNWYHQ